MPSTPFIGVRISWLMLARNSLFALFAALSDCRRFGGASRGIRQATVAGREFVRARRDPLFQFVARSTQLGVASLDLS